MARTPDLLVIACLLLLGTPACGDDSDAPDAGPAETDAGPAETDAGPAETDAGPAETDAGPAETDAGPAETDAGPAETDAGPAETDAGPAETDAGPAETDAGPADLDAGPAATDAGPAETDAGPAETDAGPAATDAGSPAPDAGPPGATTTFLVFRDFRRCAAPLCGGFWLQSVNVPSTRCIDGTTADSCYVPGIDWAAAGLSDEQQSMAEGAAGRLLVDGAIGSRIYGAHGDLGELRASAAWTADWGPVPARPSPEAYYGILDMGLSCLIPPCFTFEHTLLDIGDVGLVSTLDLSPAGAPPADEAAGYAAARSGLLRVAGTITTDDVPGPAGEFGRTLTASQFYLPVSR